MIPLSSILVDIEAAAERHPALERAVALASRCGAAVKIVDVLPDVPAGGRRFLTPGMEQELVAHRRERLAATAAQITGVPVTTELLRGRPATAIVGEVLRSGHELVVRSHARDLAEAPRRFGAVDMELLRHCPCPVWLIGPGSGTRLRRILAAVHSHTDDQAEQKLNATILELALTLKEIEGGELTVLEAWSVFGEDLLRSRLSHAEFTAAIDAARQEVERDLGALMASFGGRTAGAAFKLLQGPPEDVIPQYVQANGIDVVVMGTVARSGIAGLVMGNTAERVLQRLRGSVLAVKPEGFVSPVASGASPA